MAVGRTTLSWGGPFEAPWAATPPKPLASTSGGVLLAASLGHHPPCLQVVSEGLVFFLFFAAGGIVPNQIRPTPPRSVVLVRLFIHASGPLKAPPLGEAVAPRPPRREFLRLTRARVLWPVWRGTFRRSAGTVAAV